MNWYVKYRAQYTDDLGVNWKIHIKEKAASPFDIVDFQCAGTPLIFDWFGSDEVFDQHIMGSKMDLNIWNKEDFVLMDLFNADQLQFKTVVYYGNDQLYWSGYVLPGSYQEPYNQVPLHTTITSTDGLGLLKEFQFKDLEYITRQKPALVIYEILHLVGITQFTEYINLYSDGMDNDVDDSPLDQLGIDPQLYEEDNCYQALESILQTFNAGIKQDLGKFIIFRFPEIKDSIMYGRKFTSAISKSGVSKNPDQFIKRKAQDSFIRDVEGGTLTMVPQASRHIINYDIGYKESALRNWQFNFEDFKLNGSYSIPFWVDYNINIMPLSIKLSGEEHGVYIEKGTGLGHLTQEIEGVKTRMPQFKLSFEYRLHNTDLSNSYYIAVTYRASIEGASTQYWRARDNVWSTNPDSSIVFNDFADPGWSDWINVDIPIAGVPFDGKLVVRLYAVATNTSPYDQIKVIFKNLKLVMTPIEGAGDTGIGYEVTCAPLGRIIEKEYKLGDGFTISRWTVNQLINYNGILNLWYNSDPIDPSTQWHTRGNSENKAILELINDQLGAQYVRPRQLIDLPVWVKDPETFISQVANLQDPLNKENGNNRKFHITIKSFDAKRHEYNLILTEII